MTFSAKIPSVYSEEPVTVLESYAARERVDVSELTYVGYRIVFTSDLSPLGGAKVTFQDTVGDYFTNSQGWVILPVYSNELGKKSWKIDEIISGGLHDFQMNVSDPEVIFDEIILTLDSSLSRVGVGTTRSVPYSGVYAYDRTAFTGEVFFNENSIYSDQTGEKEYYVTGINDDVYGITQYRSNTINVIFDKIIINLEAGVDRINVGSSADIYAITATHLYDGRAFNGDIYLSNTLVKNRVGKYTYTVQSISDNEYDISVFESNSVDIIFDRVDFTLSVEDRRVNIGERIGIQIEGTYSYSGSTFDGSVELTNNNNKLETVGHLSYSVANIDDSLYQLTEFSSNDIVVIWDRVQIELVSDSSRVNVGDEVSVTWQGRYEYDGTPFSQYNEVTLNSDIFIKQSVGDLTFRVRQIRDSLYGISEFISEPSTVIWDSVEVTINFPFERIEVGNEAEPTIIAEYKYDSSPFRGTMILDNSLKHEEIGRQRYTVSSIQDSLYGLETFTSNNAQIIFDRISATEEMKGNTIGSFEAIYHPVFESDGREIQGVQIVGNGKTAIPIGAGDYQIRLSNWGPTMQLSTEISVDGFSAITLLSEVVCYGNIGVYSIVGLAILIGLTLSIPMLLFSSKIKSFARQDYDRSRGTIHKETLINSLGNLRNEIKRVELYLVDLKKELQNTSTRLRDSKANEETIEKISKLEEEITLKLSESQVKLDYLFNLEAQAVYHINRLVNVQPALFIRSYKGDNIASEEATKYLMGIFPEWRRKPGWYKAVTERYAQGKGTKIGN